MGCDVFFRKFHLVKSNHRHIPQEPRSVTLLRQRMQEEKEAMVSMFLANAPQEELSEKFQLIHELNRRVQERRDRTPNSRQPE